MGLEITELLELPNIYVESYSKTDKGWLLQLRPLSDGMRCPGCGRFIDRVHQAPKVIIRDLAILKRPVHLQIPRRQFHCQGCFILALHWMQMRIESGKSLIAC
ncbi:MAG: transposase family protein [Aphanocapsa lilacina HA4352-LM1]|jgi:transposase|nr:transposase family protein [Aphanocapsa lilacina HA4352-LM1]